MKKSIILTSVIILIVGLLGGYAIAVSSKSNSANLNQSQNGFGKRQSLNKSNCLADECLMVNNFDYPADNLSDDAKKALVDAINDEYKAYSLYEKTIEKLGFVRPFSMIIRAEEQHISSLKALFDKYGLDIPKNDWASKVSAQGSLREACQAGVDAEIANAQLYRDKLLPIVSDYEDIKFVFNNLMNASQDKHLRAFENCN